MALKCTSSHHVLYSHIITEQTFLRNVLHEPVMHTRSTSATYQSTMLGGKAETAFLGGLVYLTRPQKNWGNTCLSLPRQTFSKRRKIHFEEKQESELKKFFPTNTISLKEKLIDKIMVIYLADFFFPQKWTKWASDWSENMLLALKSETSSKTRILKILHPPLSPTWQLLNI